MFPPYTTLRCFLLTAAAALAFAGCAQQQRASNRTTPLPPSPEPETLTPLGSSVDGRPLTLHCFHCTPGSRPVLILAAIHGDEPTTAYCAEQLLTILRATPSLTDGIPVAILPVANPDGLARHARTNAHGVDLNRNFPASNFVRSPSPHSRNYAGPSPASEPETQILIRLIDRLNPRRICSIHSIGQGRQQNNYDGPAQGLAELMSRHNPYPASPNIGYATPGSLGTYAGMDRQIPTITLELPSRTPAPAAWADNRAALLAFIRGR